MLNIGGHKIYQHLCWVRKPKFIWKVWTHAMIWWMYETNEARNSCGVDRRTRGKSDAGKPRLGVYMLTGEQQLSAGYHNASVSQAPSRSGRGHNGEEGRVEGKRRGSRLKKSYWGAVRQWGEEGLLKCFDTEITNVTQVLKHRFWKSKHGHLSFCVLSPASFVFFCFSFFETTISCHFTLNRSFTDA